MESSSEVLRGALSGAQRGLISIAALSLILFFNDLGEMMYTAGAAVLLFGVVLTAAGEFATNSVLRQAPCSLFGASVAALAFAAGAALPLLALAVVDTPTAGVVAVCATTALGHVIFSVAAAKVGGTASFIPGLRALVAGACAIAICIVAEKNIKI